MSAWPPETLTVNTDEIINECELMEVLPEQAVGKQFVPIVELAALLWKGEYVHARHTWRRWKDRNPPALLAEWWTVGAALMDTSAGDGTGDGGDLGRVWQGLAHIQANHPAPLNQYSTEVGTAIRKRILEQFPPTRPYLERLQFGSAEELEQFCEQHHVGPKYPSGYGKNSRVVGDHTTQLANLTQMVAFLEPKPGPVRTT